MSSRADRTVSIVIQTALCLSAVGAAGTAAAQPLAVSRADVRVADGPRAIVAADFDRDGRPDLATANLGAASVSVVLNAGSGAYRYAFDYKVGAGPFDLAAADFNGDGFVDLAVANADANSVSVLVGTHGGAFTGLAPFATSVSPRGLAVGDFDRDGRTDLAVSAWGANRVEVYRGDGTGRFALLATTPTGVHPQGLATGDINQDGKLDLVVAHNNARTAVFFGNGRGGFALHELLNGAVAVRVVTLGYFNHDSLFDLAAVTLAGSVEVYSFNNWNLPGGSRWTFQLVRTLTTPMAQDTRGIVAADVNGDGWVDLATANRGSNNLTVYTGQQENWFAAGTNLPAGAGARAVASADFDRDGRADLATVNEHGDSSSVMHNRTDMGSAGFSFSSARAVSLDQGAFHALYLCIGTYAVGGTDQFAMYVRPDDGRIALNSPLDGEESARRVVEGPPGARECAIADFNRSGWNDLAVLSMTNRALYTYPTRDRLLPGDIAPVVTPIGGLPIGLAVGEFNGDGIPDVAVTSDDHADDWAGITIFLGQGDFTFRAAGRQALYEGYPDMTVADFNRDGRADVIASDGFADDIVFLAGDGAGGLLPPSRLPWGGGPSDLATADFDEDGILDVVVLDDYSNARVMLGNGDGTFRQPTEYVTQTMAPSRFDLTVGDINRDGHADIVTARSILFGDGDGGFSSPLELAGGLFAPVVVDGNRDGLPDLVTTTRFPEGVGLLILMNTRNTTNGAPQADAGPDQSAPSGGLIRLDGNGSSDPDSHALRFEWRDERGEIAGDRDTLTLRRYDPGTYTYTLTVLDQFGASSTDSVVLEIRTDSVYREIVLWADIEVLAGNWQYVNDPTAAGNTRLYQTNVGAPKVAAPAVNPAHYIEYRFYAEAGYPYHLWIRGKADQNNWANDSVFVQFDNTVTGVNGSPIYRIGTTSGLAWNLEECSGCGIAGWGWEDTGWGAVNQLGPDIQFATTGWQRVRIQAREDGVSIDQIVLSAGDYFRTRPGQAKNDNTILTRKP